MSPGGFCFTDKKAGIKPAFWYFPLSFYLCDCDKRGVYSPRPLRGHASMVSRSARRRRGTSMTEYESAIYAGDRRRGAGINAELNYFISTVAPASSNFFF